MNEIAIVFDIGEVLCFVSGPRPAGRWIQENLGSLREKREIWAQVESEFACLNRQAFLGTITEEEFGEQSKEILQLDETAAVEYMTALWVDCIGSLNEELVRYFKGLRKRCKTGLLSNSFVGSSRRREAAHKFGLMTDMVVYSNDVGLLKPDERIYDLICNRLRVIPKDVFFLDDREVNVQAARALGMTGCLYRSNQSAIACVEDWLAERGRLHMPNR